MTTRLPFVGTLIVADTAVWGWALAVLLQLIG